jgi:hypothetical protein
MGGDQAAVVPALLNSRNDECSGTIADVHDRKHQWLFRITIANDLNIY